MPNRYLREGINSSRAVASLDAPTEVFYRRMINVVDDFGRFEVDTLLIRSQAYPVHSNIRETDISRWLAACEKAGLFVLYEVFGRQYLVLTKTERPRAQNSRYPDPPPHLVERFGLFTSANICSHAKTSASNTNTNTNTNTKARADADAIEPPAPLDATDPGLNDRPIAPPHAGQASCLPVAAASSRGFQPEATARNPRPAPAPEIPAEPQAITMTATAGIPADFARFVYQDWATRAGKDASGNLVAWLPYVIKRWTREQTEWKAGTHSGKKALAKLPRPDGVPTNTQVLAYTKEKWGDNLRHVNWSVSFFAHWNDPKRAWKRNGHLIDWKIELTHQVAKWRNQ